VNPGGCDRDRTCDPLGVNEVLYRCSPVMFTYAFMKADPDTRVSFMPIQFPSGVRVLSHATSANPDDQPG